MDMYQKRKIREEKKIMIVKKVFQKSELTGINRIMENFLLSLINKDF